MHAVRVVIFALLAGTVALIQPVPGLYGQVVRPKQVRISAYSLEGKEIQSDATGLFARCVQHELDHLDGVLFPDRMSPTAKADIAEGLAEYITWARGNLP